MDCTFTLNKRPMSALSTPIGPLAAFSGDGDGRNNADSASAANHGAIPPGCYHIVDRVSGGLLGPIRDYALSRDEWFALYREDGELDDQTYVGRVQRGEFRLHPLGPRGMSTGCIVLQHKDEFARLRTQLLREGARPVHGTGVRSYGIIEVMGAKPVRDEVPARGRTRLA
jgi:hypothetical protein